MSESIQKPADKNELEFYEERNNYIRIPAAFLPGGLGIDTALNEHILTVG